jgi:DNA-binding XRE family transcriptional regulator
VSRPPAKKVSPRKTAAVPRKKAEPTIAEHFGRQIRRHRLAQNMSQAAMAYGAGISQTRVPAIEAGRVNVHLNTAHALARSLGVSLRILLPE